MVTKEMKHADQLLIAGDYPLSALGCATNWPPSSTRTNNSCLCSSSNQPERRQTPPGLVKICLFTDQPFSQKESRFFLFTLNWTRRLVKMTGGDW